MVTRIATHFLCACDNFEVKYINKEDAEHLIASIKKTYKLTKDWFSSLYCSIALEWDYVNRTVAISMPGYIKKIAGVPPHHIQHKANMPIFPSS
jgi:hypothetical protein